MQRPLDNDVQLICQNQDLNNMIFTTTDGLPAQLAGSVELAVTRAMQPVSKSLDNFLIGATRAQIEGVSRIVGSFIEQMNSTLDGQLLSLGQTMTQINQQNDATIARVAESIETAGAMLTDVSRMHAVSENMLSHFERFVSDINVAQQRTEGFEQNSAALLEKMHAAADQQAATLRMMRDYQNQLAGSLDRFSTGSASAMENIRQMNNQSAERLNDAGESMHEASQQLARSYETFVSNVVEGLSRALGLFDQNMTALMDTLGEKVDSIAAAGNSAAAVQQLGEMQRLMASMEATLRRAADLSAQTDKEG